MQPIGPLMHEHRLIERMLAVLNKERERMSRDQTPDSQLIEQAVDFFRTYADRCHHGKEEDILFRELKNKNLSPELQTIMEELIQEHVQGRRMVKELDDANLRLVRNRDVGAIRDMEAAISELLTHYPRHIEKEDKRFFFPVMELFSRQEMADMLEEYEEFEKELLHHKYQDLVQAWEKDAGLA